jgi:hypothetical protein
MNQFRLILAASVAMTALAFAVPTAAHPEHQTKEEVREIKIIKSDKAGGEHLGHGGLADDCGNGRKFESTASAGDGTGEKRVSKMVICSDPGESDAEWAKTLRGALADVQSNTDMPAEGKAKIMADLTSEIAKLGK